MAYHSLKRQVWAEINMSNFLHNINLAKERIEENTKLMLVLKADAYGHGAVKLAEFALKHNISFFGVATLEEALQLRERFKEPRILILGYTLPYHALEAIKNNIELCIYDMQTAKEFSNIASKENKEALAHIKLDTGMNRIGYKYTARSIKEIQDILNLPYINVKGIFTHFATADSNDLEYFNKQNKGFQDFLDSITLPKNILLHCANSASLLRFKQSHRDMVRLGISAYGLKPSIDMDMQGVKLKPAMSLKANIIHIKEIGKDEGVSYNKTFIANKKSKIATLPIGYADGYMRLLSNKADVLIHGKRAPVIGNICMDHCMVDISHLENVKIGDCALLFGYDNMGNELSVDELANHIGTINYELVCAVSKRVPRVYVKNT
ncbi:alanine racemase [Helicobacter muridarum]|uniref:Alanine racemase n=2 Tax=Helicobacter muridarum TaxID=216 RepID=A0A4U8TNF8_9HELI|nr:alanine racemase [Helicobacter muridarum]TLE01566.1 alanine racemase [Helicobacter muridarum]